MASPKADSPPAAASYQRLFLRITLGTLVVGAVVGAALLLAGAYSGGGRVLATCLVSAAAAGLMMRVGIWLDDAARRRAGVVGTCVVMTAFLFAMASIWIDAVMAPPWGWQWQLALSAVATVTIGGVCAGLLALAPMPEMRWASRLGVPLGGACLLLALVSIWQRSVAGLDSLFIAFIWTSAAATLATVNLSLDKRHWRWLGVLSAAVLLLDAISGFLGNGTLLEGIAPFLWATAGSVAVVNVLMTIRAPEWAWFLRWVAMACTVIAALVAAVYEPILSQGGYGDDWVIRLIGALTLLGGCSGVGLVIAVRIGATKKWNAVAEPYKSLTISCPRCAKRQSINLPEAACVNCALHFRISMHDDRCATCGYDTSGLKLPVCPECGGGVVLRSEWETAQVKSPI